MSDHPNTKYRIEKTTEWVPGGDLAVAVEVEVIFPPDAPHEPCYRPQTVSWLEHLRRCAERGDVAELERAGRVYERRAAVTK
jgi:hypothetical protein